jgi:hypothetical protein
MTRTNDDLFLVHVKIMDQVGITIEDESLVESIAANKLRKIPNKKDCAATREKAFTFQFIKRIF